MGFNTAAIYFLLSLNPPPAPVPPPAAAAAPRAESPFKAKAELSFVNTTGNTATQTLGTAAEIDLTGDRWHAHSEARYVRTNAEDALRAESITAHTRLSRGLWDEVSAYGEARFVRNAFAGLRRQTTIEVGLSKLFSPRSQQWRAEAAVGHIDEDRLTGIDRRLTSGTAGLRYRIPLSKTSTWTQQAHVTTALTDSSDWRLRHEASIAAGLTSVFSLKFTHTLTYLREPVAGFERTDTASSAALVATF